MRWRANALVYVTYPGVPPFFMQEVFSIWYLQCEHPARYETVSFFASQEYFEEYAEILCI